MLMQSSLRATLQEAFRVRMYFYMIVTSVVFGLLLLQLVNLQLLQGREYTVKARLNMESNIPIPAARGDIYDRNFKEGERNVVVVSNRPSFNITTIPAKFKSKKKLEEILDLLARVLGVNKEEILGEINTGNPWERVVLKEDVEFDTIVKIASHQDRFPNIDWEDASVRVYNFSEMFAHVVGYVGSISRDEYRRLKTEGYKHYQKIGKAGIEKQFDRILRGRDGYVRRIVDVRQRTEGEEVGAPPVAGNNMVLTIDYNIQNAIYDSMKDMKGAAIVIKPSIRRWGSAEMVSTAARKSTLAKPSLLASPDTFTSRRIDSARPAFSSSSMRFRRVASLVLSIECTMLAHGNTCAALRLCR